MKLFVCMCVRVRVRACVRACVSPGKTQVMGEIKIALKKEMKTEGEHLVLEILQCRNITYKFKTADHLPGTHTQTDTHTHTHTHRHTL